MQNQGLALLAGFSYGGHFPGGDLAERFGTNFSPGLGVELMTDKKNWILGLSGDYFFGQEVKTDVLAGLRTPEGYLIGNDRTVADIQLRERGFFMGLHLGRLFSLSAANPRSGLRLTLGAGLLQHRIRIQDDPVRTVPQLTGDYRKGYDRLTNGLALKQFIGYQQLSANRRINFYAGLEFFQGFTRNRRSFDFDTRRQDDKKRLDLLFGLRLGWVLPFYVGQNPDDIFY